MFGWLKKKKNAGYHYRHHTNRQDWENSLNEIFDEVVSDWQNCLAVISNTTQNGVNDKIGSVSERLTFRVKQGLDGSLQNAIRSLTAKEFNEIFAMEQRKKPDVSDCYMIKNMGLPNNSLVYLIEHTRSEKKTKKAILVFGGPYLKKDLNKRLEMVSSILKRAGETITASSPKTKVNIAPRPISLRQLQKASPEMIKDRLNYLEDLNKRTPEQERELSLIHI